MGHAEQPATSEAEMTRAANFQSQFLKFSQKTPDEQAKKGSGEEQILQTETAASDSPQRSQDGNGTSIDKSCMKLEVKLC